MGNDDSIEMNGDFRTNLPSDQVTAAISSFIGRIQDLGCFDLYSDVQVPKLADQRRSRRSVFKVKALAVAAANKRRDVIQIVGSGDLGRGLLVFVSVRVGLPIPWEIRWYHRSRVNTLQAVSFDRCPRKKNRAPQAALR